MLRYSISDRLLFAGEKSLSAPSTPADATHPNDEPTRSPLKAPGSERTIQTFPDLLAQAHRLALARVDFFLLREPDLPARTLAELARQILAVFRATNASTRLLLHSRPDIAVATGAHGVHLPSTPGQLAPSHLRELYRLAGLPEPVVSLSCHTLDDIRRVCAPEHPAEKPDLLLFGPVFEKRVHGELVQPGAGLPLFQEACQLAAPTLVLALGGVTSSNTLDCLEAGAAGVAGIRLFAAPV